MCSVGASAGPRIRPRDLVGEHEIHLGHARAEAIALQRLCVPGGDLIAVDAQQCRRGRIEKHDAGGRFGDLLARCDGAAVRAQVGDQRVWDGLTAADRDRPTHGVCERGQHQSGAC